MLLSRTRELRREVRYTNHIIVHHYDEPLDEILQLANVAFPRVLGQMIERFFFELFLTLSFITEPPQEGLDQQRDVFLTLTKWRKIYRDDIDTIVEVFTKPALLN